MHKLVLAQKITDLAHKLLLTASEDDWVEPTTAEELLNPFKAKSDLSGDENPFKQSLKDHPWDAARSTNDGFCQESCDDPSHKAKAEPDDPPEPKSKEEEPKPAEKDGDRHPLKLSDAASQLQRFIDNDSGLYKQRHLPLIKNLMRKRNKGVYNHATAVKAFSYLVEQGAKKLAKGEGTPGEWKIMFPPAVRHEVAQSLCEDFEAEAELGNYDDL